MPPDSRQQQREAPSHPATQPLTQMRNSDHDGQCHSKQPQRLTPIARLADGQRGKKVQQRAVAQIEREGQHAEPSNESGAPAEHAFQHRGETRGSDDVAREQQPLGVIQPVAIDRIVGTPVGPGDIQARHGADHQGDSGGPRQHGSSRYPVREHAEDPDRQQRCDLRARYQQQSDTAGDRCPGFAHQRQPEEHVVGHLVAERPERMVDSGGHLAPPDPEILRKQRGQQIAPRLVRAYVDGAVQVGVRIEDGPRRPESCRQQQCGQHNGVHSRGTRGKVVPRIALAPLRDVCDDEARQDEKTHDRRQAVVRESPGLRELTEIGGLRGVAQHHGQRQQKAQQIQVQ